MPAVRSRSRAEDAGPKPRADAYVGLLGLSLLALSAAMLFAFLNYSQVAEKPPPVQAGSTGGGAARPAVPTGPPIANPAAPGQPGAKAPPVGQPQPNQPAPPGGKAPPPPPQKK